MTLLTETEWEAALDASDLDRISADLEMSHHIAACAAVLLVSPNLTDEQHRQVAHYCVTSLLDLNLAVSRLVSVVRQRVTAGLPGGALSSPESDGPGEVRL